MSNRVIESRDLLDVQVGPVEPTTREDGSSLQVDDLWRDTSTLSQTWNVWDGTAWQPMGGDESVAVDDDGVEVVAEASGLNFGTGLSVTDDGGGDVTVDSEVEDYNPDVPQDYATLEDDEGGVWQVTVGTDGTLSTTSIAVITTEAGDPLTTEAGELIVQE